MPASHCLNRRSNASCYLEFVWVWCVRFRVLFCSASDRARGHFGNRHHRPSGLTFFRQDAPVFSSSSSSNRLKSSRSSKKFETLKFWINFISADLKFFCSTSTRGVVFRFLPADARHSGVIEIQFDLKHLWTRLFFKVLPRISAAVNVICSSWRLQRRT